MIMETVLGFHPALPDDGVLDGADETFTLTFNDLKRGTHTVTFRASDEADNNGFGEGSFDVRP